jgi:hypothetical protein
MAARSDLFGYDGRSKAPVFSVCAILLEVFSRRADKYSGGQERFLDRIDSSAGAVRPNNTSSAVWGTKTIQLKYLDPVDLREVFSGQSYVMQVNRELKLLTVSGPPEFLNEVEQTGKRLDVAPAEPANIEITVYLLATTGQTPASQELPAELQAIAKALDSGAGSPLHLVDSETLRVREGKAGEVSFGDAAPSGVGLASIGIQAASVTPGAKGDLVSLSGLHCKINKPASQGSSGGEVTANIDLVQNQAALVARAGAEKPLVVIARASVSR